MSTMRKVTAAKWSWRGDTSWIDYDAKMNLHVESEYLETNQRITIDGERFVDVSLTPKQIRVKWYCADCEDKNCIGLQRRFDDESKRRAVRREVEPFLKGLNVAILFSEDDAAYVEKMLLSHKATVRYDVTKRTKIVVLGDGVSLEEVQDQIEIAKQEDIPVVTEAWLVKCITERDILTAEIDNYKVKLPAAAKEEEEESTEPPAKKAKTAEAADDEEHVLPAKMDVDTSSSSTAPAAPLSAATATVAALPAKKSSGALPKRVPCPLKAGTQWMGVCSSEDSHIPFYLSLNSIISGAVEGTVRWPTLKNAELKMKGTVMGDIFQYTEYEVIRGEEDVETGTEYTAKIDGENLSGSWELPGGDMSGTFSASLLLTPENTGNGAGLGVVPAADPTEARNGATNNFALHFTSGSTYQGKCYTESEFKLTINKRTGNVVEGIVEWPAHKYTTAFQGEIDGVQLKFSETSVAAQDPTAVLPTLPILYQGAMDEKAQSVKGSRAGLLSGANFTINLTP